MKHKIGFFVNDTCENEKEKEVCNRQQNTVTGRKSLVQVYFWRRNRTLTYYNDMFDLKVGDIVFVDGKLENERGCVVEISYTFKIKLSDYKRVIAVADTDVHGKLFMDNCNFYSFDKETLSKEKVRTWFFPPQNHDDEDIVVSFDDTTFPLSELNKMKISENATARGFEYYREGKVRYISLDKNKGYAIVDGTHFYEVEFEYNDGEISNLICSCPCSSNCKHNFATMLQLRDCLKNIEDVLSNEVEYNGYFASVTKSTMYNLILSMKTTGSIIL